MLEAPIEQTVVTWAEERGMPHLKLNVQGRRGWPDQIFFVLGGRPVLLEFKRPGKKPEPLQAHIHAMLRELNYDVYYCDTAKEAIQVLANAVRRATTASRLPAARR